MRDEGNKKGRGRNVENRPGTLPAGTEGNVTPAKATPLTAKEKIAANQKNKRRK